MIKALLEETGAGGGIKDSWPMLVIFGVLIIAIVVFYVLTSKKRKKQEKDAQDLINAVKPGNKVKTIGGICGIVVEVDNEENTFVLETGTEASGKSYLKFDRQAIYQTDAVVDSAEAAKNGKSDDNKTEEAADGVTSVSEPLTEGAASAEDKPAGATDVDSASGTENS